MAENAKFKMSSLRKLNVKLNGKELYKGIYRTSGVTSEAEVREFAQKRADDLEKMKSRGDFMVSIVYENLGIRSSKFTKTGSQVKVNDESDSDYADAGNIIGFTLTFTL